MPETGVLDAEASPSVVRFGDSATRSAAREVQRSIPECELHSSWHVFFLFFGLLVLFSFTEGLPKNTVFRYHAKSRDVKKVCCFPPLVSLVEVGVSQMRHLLNTRVDEG